MKHTLEKCINTVQRNRQKFRRYVSLLLVLSMLTTLGVNRGLLQNGMSLSHTADYICGLEEHVHTEDCYEKVLICGYDDEEAEGAPDSVDTVAAAQTRETVSPERSAADFEAVDAADPAETDGAESALTGISEEQTALTGETAEVTEDPAEIPDEDSGDFEGETEYESPYKRGTIIRDEDNRLNLGFLTRIGAAIEGLLQDANDIGKVYAAADDGTRKTTASASNAQASGTTAETTNTAENTAGAEESESGAEETAGTEETTGAIETTGAAEETPAAETAAVADGSEKRHVHTDACYKKKLICGMKEHVHTPECLLSVQVTGKEKAEDWEATLPELEEYTGIWAWDLVLVAQSQIGYIESEEDFLVSDDGDVRNGYTRYGAWYGNEYADWSSMFAAFCLYYTGVPTDAMPVNSGCVAWAAALKKAELYRTAGEYEPKIGDIVFLDTEKDDGKSDRVGIIEELIYEDGSRSGDLAEFAAINESGESNGIGESEDSGVISETSASEEREALGDANDADENPDLTETAAADAEIAVSGDIDGTGDLNETENTVPDEDASAKTVVGFTAIVGDIDGAVEEIEYTVDDEMIRGYAELPENPEPGDTELAASRRVTLATDSNADAAATDSNADKLLPEEPATDSNAKKEVTYPAFTDEQIMEDGTVIHVDAPEGAFPEGIQLKLEKRDAAEYLDAIRAFTGNEELTADYWLAYDFDFYTDEENHNIEPKTEIKVTFENPAAIADLVNAASEASEKDADDVQADDTDADDADTEDTQSAESEIVVYHIGGTDEGAEPEVSQTSITGVNYDAGTLEIKSDEFSVQLVANGPGGGGGYDPSITATYDTNVEHIDIGISAIAEVTINGKTSSATVSLEKADFTSGNVTVSAKYQKETSAPYFNTKNYSDITESEDRYGNKQVRVNGTYRTGTLSDPAIYTLTLRKEVTFTIDSEEVTLPVTLSGSFHFFQSSNRCPNIHDSHNVKGKIDDDSGMDFILDCSIKLITISKQVVDQDGNPLNVSNYTVYFDVNNSSDSEAAKILLDGTSSGWAIEQVKSTDSLKITEQTPPQTVTVDGITYNYLKTLINNQEGTSFSTSGTDSFTVKNYYEVQKKSIKIIKYDANNANGKHLPGAQFTLTSESGGTVTYYMADGSTSTDKVIYTTDTDGVIKFDNLPYGTYILTEVKAPEGYNTLPNPITVVIDGEGVTYTNGNKETVEEPDNDGYYELMIANKPGYSLPSAGGAGTTPFTVGGSVLTGAALLYGYHLMRKREGGTE